MSRTSVKSRLASRLPTCSTGGLRPFSMSAICLAKSEATNTGPRRGPSWLKPRVRTQSTFHDIQYW